MNQRYINKNIYLLLLGFTLLFSVSCKKKDKADEIPVNTIITTSAGGLVTFSPEFPTDDAPVTLTFDPSKGNGGLNGFTGDVFLHTGVITNLSTGPGNWKYVKAGSFNEANPATKMTYFNGKYTFTLSPRAFYQVPAGEKILKIALLFRNADGSKVGRNKDNSDIYIPVFDAGTLNVRFNFPEFEPYYTPAPVITAKLVGDEITVSAISSKTANLTLSLNGTSFATSSNSTKIAGKVKITQDGIQLIKITATDGGASSEDTFSFLISGTPETVALPAGAKDGVTFINNGTSAILNLTAPGKDNVYVIGDFNDWKPDSKYFMKRTPDLKRWWIQIDNLDPSKEYAYQYLVDGALRIADPYTEKVLDPNHDSSIPSATYPALKAYPTGKTTGNVSELQANQATYNWSNTAFNRPDKKNLVIYELHLRDFIAARNYSTLVDTLNYLSNLGVNAIELMPVNEFEGNSSWGYNPSFYFTADKYYGTKNALKNLIDECHKRGIAVILDMVLNHSFGQSPMVQLYFNSATGKPAANSPWFNPDPKHPFNVGYDFNHESAETKYFSKKVMEFWIKEYKIDGYRFDLSKGFTQKNSGDNADLMGQYDASRIAIWNDYNNFIKSIDPNAYVILEHFGSTAEEKELSNAGMMLWNNINHSMNQATMGYLSDSDFSWGFYTSHDFTQPYNLVTYMESHDEERLMFKNLTSGNSSDSYTIRDLATALKRQEMAAAFFFAIPGPKMIWQFGELGYDKSINENGRVGEKPILWNYNTGERRDLYKVYSKLINMKIKNPIFTSTDFSKSLNGIVKYIQLKSATTNVVVLGNFDVTSRPATITFPAGGTWYEQLTGESINVPGGAYSATLAPGEYHVYSNTQLMK
jgi:1,4-alpha-glucan branching enzyme